MERKVLKKGPRRTVFLVHKLLPRLLWAKVCPGGGWLVHSSSGRTPTQLPTLMWPQVLPESEPTLDCRLLSHTPIPSSGDKSPLLSLEASLSAPTHMQFRLGPLRTTAFFLTLQHLLSQRQSSERAPWGLPKLRLSLGSGPSCLGDLSSGNSLC